MTCAECVHSRPMTGEERKRFAFVPDGQVVCGLFADYRIDTMDDCGYAKPAPAQGELGL